MPLIHVLNATPSDSEQRRALITELTHAYATVMRIRPDTIRVLIQELPRDSWGVGGVPIDESGQDESISG